jgi:hypothetical protein
VASAPLSQTHSVLSVKSLIRKVFADFEPHRSNNNTHGWPNSELRTPNLNRLVAALLKWFAANARDLQWRRTHDPYAIWVSEIILQNMADRWAPCHIFKLWAFALDK